MAVCAALLDMVPETPRRQPYTWKEAPKALGDLRAGRKVLLKVHGTAEHHETVVMSEVEYREARADASYQAVLRYLLQEHVFLFVGYGMNDPLDLDLALAGNLGVFNDSAQRHYVLLKGATNADCDRYESAYNVRVIGYAEHIEVLKILARLAEAKEATRVAAQPYFRAHSRRRRPMNKVTVKKLLAIMLCGALSMVLMAGCDGLELGAIWGQGTNAWNALWVRKAREAEAGAIPRSGRA